MKAFKYLSIFFLICFSCKLFAQSDTQNALLANEYYKIGEYEKALKLYQQLASVEQVNSLIHSNYLQLLEQKQLNEEAKSYLTKILALAPNNISYRIDAIAFYTSIGDTATADKQFELLENQVINNYSALRTSAQLLVNEQQFQYAEALYLEARKKSNNDSDFAIQLATLYRYQNKLDKMVNEFIKYVEESPGRLRYVKSMLQLTLKEEEQINLFIQKLMGDIQNDPDNIIYAELLIWANLQLENYYGAFIQAKALDKRTDAKGTNSMEIGKLALNNQEYTLSKEIFQFVINEYPNSNFYLEARELIIYAKQKLVENSLPVDSTEIKELIEDYELLFKEEGINRYTLNAYRELALLYAFYTSDSDKAIGILKEIITNPQSNSEMIALSKLNLGDIYLIIDQPWESTLLYSQVEKSHKNSELGEKAKLKNATISFYTGKFKLAQEHLDILKRTTRREIANNAIDLSILIKNNTINDTTNIVLEEYASVDLLLFQNKVEEAEAKIKDLINEYDYHPIIDELYWLYAKILLKRGAFEEAIENLQIIVEELPQDILTDDALFEQARIYEENLQEKEKAKSLYQKLLIDYPGSIFVAEARKRFRSIRGDFVN